MNKEEYLLTQLQEECAEVITACSKIIRFGWDSCYADGTNNTVQLVKELHDIIGVLEVLKHDTPNGQYLYWNDEEQIDIKCQKVQYYMRIAKEIGTLNE